MHRETRKFLYRLSKYGYTRVCIHIRHKDVPHSLTWQFTSENSAFAYPETIYDKDNWPAIWKVCNELGYGGCGNCHQHNVPDTLQSGYYKFIKGKWKLISIYENT